MDGLIKGKENNKDSKEISTLNKEIKEISSLKHNLILNTMFKIGCMSLTSPILHELLNTQELV